MRKLTTTLASLTLAAGIALAGCSNGLTEDSASWDCRYDGNNVCGPDNASRHAPGLYFPDADGLRLVKAWPEGQPAPAFHRSLDVNGDGHLSDIELGA